MAWNEVSHVVCTGMFMVCVHVRDKDGALLSHSCRSAMLHYRSELLLSLKTLVFSPLFMLGPAEEKQGVTVELFQDYMEDAVSSHLGAEFARIILSVIIC